MTASLSQGATVVLLYELCTAVMQPSLLLMVSVVFVQEAGGWGLPPPDCSPSKGASFSDRAYDNPTFSIFNTTTYEQSPDLALTILLAAWPLSSFPFVFQLPIGSVLVISGNSPALALPLPHCLSLSKPSLCALCGTGNLHEVLHKHAHGKLYSL